MGNTFQLVNVVKWPPYRLPSWVARMKTANIVSTPHYSSLLLEFPKTLESLRVDVWLHETTATSVLFYFTLSAIENTLYL
jgi:hypothetical protein